MIRTETTCISAEGKTLPCVRIDLSVSEIAEYALYCAKSEPRSKYNLLSQYGQDGRKFYTGGRPDLTREEAEKELRFLSSDYWNARRKSAIASLAPAEPQSSPEYRMETTGLFFDVSRVLEGQPECWYSQDDQPERKMEIKIHYFVEVSVGATHLFQAFEQVINTYKSLTRHGYKVRLIICFKSALTRAAGGNPIIGSEVNCVASDYDQYLDEAVFTYLVSPTFYRLFVFGMQEKVLPNRQNGFYTKEVFDNIYKKPIQLKDGVLHFYGLVKENLKFYTMDHIQKVLHSQG